MLVPPPAFTFASVSCFKLLSSQVKVSVLAGITSSMMSPKLLTYHPANVVPFPKSRVYDFPSVNVHTPIKLLSSVWPMLIVLVPQISLKESVIFHKAN